MCTNSCLHFLPHLHLIIKGDTILSHGTKIKANKVDLHFTMTKLLS